MEKEEKMQRYIKEIYFPATWPRTEICKAIDKQVDEIIEKAQYLYGED